jgi:pimeloyl-ACP methyl ester carboxylesterase
MAAWRTVISYFSEEYRIVTFDLPGQGRARILSGPYHVSLEEQVEVLRRLILEVSPHEKVHLAGASWGGIIVAVLAVQYGHLVEKIILASFGVKPSSQMIEMIRKGQGLYKAGKKDAVARLIIDTFGQKMTEANKKKMAEQFQNMPEEQAESFYAHCDMIASSRGIDEFVDLRKIQAKTLIINGEKDTLLNGQDIRAVGRLIPHCEVRIVKGAGHFLHWENEEILDIYRDYLSEWPASGSKMK